MPHPIPIIIGTTIAVAATGYAFKKFVYDPHLAPIIDNFIEAHRIHRMRYETIPVSVASDGSLRRDDRGGAGAPAPLRDSGRSTAVESKGSHVRQRRPAESYELDESRVLFNAADEMDKKEPIMADSGKTVTYSPKTHRRKPVPSLDDKPPLISLDREARASSSAPPYMENPFADAVTNTARTPSPANLAPTPIASSPSSAAMSLVPSPAPSHTTLIDHPSPSPSITSASVDMDDIEIVSVSGTAASYIDAETYSPPSFSPSLSANNSRPVSPPVSLSMLASELSFPSPTPGGSLLGSELTFPAPNTSGRRSPHPIPSASGRSTPSHILSHITSRDESSAAHSVSSWTEDEWHTGNGNGNSTDSEWDAVSDAPSRE